MKKYHLIIIVFLLFLTTGCGKKSIIGKWKAVNAKDKYYYIFNKNKTCSYEMSVARLDCTYKINKKKIIIKYKGNDKTNTFEYFFRGNSLVIVDENNKNNEFVKEKNK